MVHKNQHTFIVFEGCDGTGKTEVAKMVAERIGAAYYKSPSGPFAKIRSAIDDTVDHLSRFYFYRAAVQYDSKMISELLESSPVISDRYIDSTNLIHCVKDERVKRLINNDTLLIPDMVIILSAQPEVCRQRLAQRGNPKKDELNESLQLQIAETFAQAGYPIIDTTGTTVEEAADLAVLLINEE